MNRFDQLSKAQSDKGINNLLLNLINTNTFSYHFEEYVKLDTCSQFHDHWSNNNALIPHPLMTDGSQKEKCQIGLMPYCPPPPPPPPHLG